MRTEKARVDRNGPNARRPQFCRDSNSLGFYRPRETLGHLASWLAREGMYAAKGHVFKADTDRTAIVTAPLNLPLYSALPVTSINLQDILIALGGQAAFLGAVARLAKS